MKVLRLLKNSHNALSVTAVSEELGIKYETVINAVSFLENCGLLILSTERHGDLTYQYVRLSDLGSKVAEAMKNDILNRQ